MILMETVYVRQDSWGRAARQVGTSVTLEPGGVKVEVFIKSLLIEY